MSPVEINAMHTLSFGQLPPKLFTYQRPLEVLRYRQGVQWQNPDGDYTEAELKTMLHEPGGALRQYRENGFWGTYQKLGFEKFLSEMRPIRIAKETVKTLLKDPIQDYLPYAINGVWMHRHDRDHMVVSELPPIQVGAYKNVTGVNGIDAALAPHFHPEDPDFKGQYPGDLDEYRVAVHQHVTDPSPSSRARLAFYATKFIAMVPNPKAVIDAHRESLTQQTHWKYRLKQGAKRLIQTLRYFVRGLFRGGEKATY